MEKIWYINIDGKSEGPFSVAELKFDNRINPDTLVWKQGFTSWVRMRDVPELKPVFEDSSPKNTQSESSEENSIPLSQDELVIDLKRQPPYLFWLLVALIVLIYFVSQLFWLR